MSPLPLDARVRGVLLLAALLSRAGSAWAADTVETWDPGAVDVDAYVGVDGLGGSREARAAFLDAMLGYGAFERVSVYVGTTQNHDVELRHVGGEYYWGAFATAVEGAHFDFDVFIDVWSGGDRNSEIALTPALELNLDADPDQRSVGVYLRAGLPYYGLSAASPSQRDVSYAMEADFGAYASVAPGHMLFAEYDVAWREPASSAQRPLEHGGVALGYNVTVGDAVEIINEVHVDIPEVTGETTGGVMTGVILTLPDAS